MDDELPTLEAVTGLQERVDAEARAAVLALRERFGFGRIMHMCERLWEEEMPGSAHSVGCGTMFLVPCPAHRPGEASQCDWCCGSGRVTRRVALAIERGSDPG